MPASGLHLLPGTLLLVDDDEVVLRRYARETLRATNLGVLTAADIPTGVQYVDEYPIAAILSDVYFRAGTEDGERELRDGLDFLGYVRQRHPTIPLYVMSMEDPNPRYTSTAASNGLRLHWFDKLPSWTGMLSPWVRIEVDLIRAALVSTGGEPSDADGARAGALESVVDRVRTAFRGPRVTYLQNLPPEFGHRVRKPIEVLCWTDAVGVRAMASGIPLPHDVRGHDAAEAVANLANLLAEALPELYSEGSVEYVRHVRDLLSAHLEPVSWSDSDLDPGVAGAASGGDPPVGPPRKPIATALDWASLSPEAFERLIFNLLRDAEGYDNAQWLTATNAVDRGRDLSVERRREDRLGSTTHERVIVQAKHWLARSIRVRDLGTLEKQMQLWEPPPVDVLVIATSGHFTQDAVQWIESHNRRSHMRIEMWPNSHLESLLSSRPQLRRSFWFGRAWNG